MFDQCTRDATALLCMVAMAVHPWAATGAAVGCCFLLFAPMATGGWQRLKLIPFSFGMGYAGAVFFYGRVAGEPWSEKAMLVAAALSALSAVTFTAFYYVIDKSGPLPAWLESILDRIPLFKRRSDSDGL
jgi:ABC-type Fe3+-siderophore transport system permease subunit